MRVKEMLGWLDDRLCEVKGKVGKVGMVGRQDL